MTGATLVTVIPGLRYADAAAAIDFLCSAFGFDRALVVEDDDGTIPHAQLTYGNGMVMLGQNRDDDLGAHIRSPAGGMNSQAAYVVVQDADAHYERARAAGAEIVRELEHWDHGGAGYTCKDPEGHVWSFGTYDPWAD